MSPAALNAAIAQALGCPKHTRKARLTLEVGRLPVLEIEMLLIDGKRVVSDGVLDIPALRSLPFILRLEPSKS